MKDHGKFRIDGLTTAGLVMLVLSAALLMRSLHGGGPSPTAAEVLPDGEEAQRDIEEIVRRAEEHLLEQQPERAERILRDALVRYPESPDLRIQLGEALLTLGRSEEAYMQYSEALSKTPENPRLQFATGTLASLAGKTDLAARHYKAAQSLDPTNPQYPLYLAQMERKLGQNDEARASLVRAAKLEPDLAIAWGTLADLSLAENNLEMAAHYLEKAAELEPGNPNWRLLQARLLRRQGQPEQVALLLSALASEARKPDPMILREQALAFGMLGRKHDAAALYEWAVAAGHPDPKTLGEINYEAAVWQERIGQPAKARAYAEQAASLGDPRAKDILKRLAQVSND